MRTKIGTGRATLTRIALVSYNSPFAIFPGFIPIFVVIILLPTRSAVIFSIILGVFTGLVSWVILRTEAISWRGVVVSATAIATSTREPWFWTDIHFAVIRSFLEMSLGDVAPDLLTVETSLREASREKDLRRTSVQIITHALRLNLMESRLGLPAGSRDSRASDYVRDLETTLGQFANSSGGVVAFLVKQFEKLDPRFVNFTVEAKPPPSIVDAIESHKTGVTVILVLTVTVVALVLHYPFGFSI